MAVRINRDDLTTEQEKQIRKHLYMQPQSTGFFNKKRFATSKDPILMWSLDKPNNQIILPYTFGNSLMGYHINSKKNYPPGKYSFLSNLYPHQIPIINEAIEHLKMYGTTTLWVYPSCGKTVMASYLSSICEGLTLVIYPITMVEPGWIKTFEEFTDAKIWHNNGKNPIPKSCNVILTMDTQFYKIPKKILDMVSVLILDESHMFCVPSRIHCLLGVTPKYIISCSATLKRSDGMESIMHSVCGMHNIFLKSDKKFTVHKLLTGIKTPIEKNKNGDTDWPKLVRDLCENKTRNSIIIHLVEQHPDHKIMILTWNKNHAFYLSKQLNEKGITSDVLAGNKNIYKDSRVLVGTIGKIGTGFDEAMACPDWGGERSNMLILTGSTKSLAGLEQITGRVFRSDYPEIIDLVDDNRICKRHWTTRKKWYEDDDRNGEILQFIVEIDFTTHKITIKPKKCSKSIKRIKKSTPEPIKDLSKLTMRSNKQ